MFCLIKKLLDITMKRIRAKKNRLSTYKICKVSLSCFDDKRYILDDGIKSLLYGHKNM